MTDKKIIKKSNRGGRRPGAGRPAGARNKTPKPVKELAEQFTEEAIETLASIMRDPEQPGAVRVAAADKLLDRGWGKPAQSVDLTIEDEFTDTEEDRAARELALERALANAALEKERMLARVKSLGKPH